MSVTVEIGNMMTTYGTATADDTAREPADRLTFAPAAEAYAAPLANICRNMRREGEGDEALLRRLPSAFDGGYLWARIVSQDEGHEPPQPPQRP